MARSRAYYFFTNEVARWIGEKNFYWNGYSRITRNIWLPKYANICSGGSDPMGLPSARLLFCIKDFRQYNKASVIILLLYFLSTNSPWEQQCFNLVPCNDVSGFHAAIQFHFNSFFYSSSWWKKLFFPLFEILFYSIYFLLFSDRYNSLEVHE